MPTELWFPTPIYYADNILTQHEINTIKNRCLEIRQTVPENKTQWNCILYTSFEQYNIKDDPVFNPLIDQANYHVNEFKKEFQSSFEYVCDHGWINIYNKDAYQEYHYHNDVTFSSVYYVSAPEGSGPTIFNSPLEPDMRRVKETPIKNNLTFTHCIYPAIENRLLIFRGNLQHMVKQGTNKEDRISVAMNFL